MNKLLGIIIIILIAFTPQMTQASHLVGGDFHYECLGNDQYRITLNVYKDCNAFGPNVADFDDPAFIGIYENGNLITTQNIFLQTRTDIPAVINNPCLQAPPDVCVEEGVYEFAINLPANSTGYKIVYQRCCRNQTIVNLSQPQNQGATFVAEIPPSSLANCNSSAEFNDFPPIAICANDPLVFDHSATDPDGDVLVYELCAPFDGGSQTLPQPNPPSAPPYVDVVYSGGFNAGIPLDANPALSIDANSGLITGTPTSIGQYVVGVCANEYRNGTLISTTKRDFQFNVTDCESNVEAAIPVVDTDPNASLGTDGVYLYECQDFTVDFINNSVNGTTYDWDFGVAGTNQDQSTDFEPSYTFPDTGSYIVRLIVNQSYPCSDTADVVVRIYPVFTTDFALNDACEDEVINFQDLTQSTYGTINNWQWDFGDGNTSSQANPSYSYSNSGTYTVELFSTNTKGCEDIQQREIKIYDTPKPSLEYTPACINQQVRFTNTSTSGGNPLVDNISWTFSNGNSSSQNSTLQTFNTLGAQTVKLVTENDFGCKDSIIQTINVNPLPNAQSSPDTTICEGDRIPLNASGGEEYLWITNFNVDNIYSPNTFANPTFTANYIVIVTDSNQCSDTSATFVNAFPKPNTSAGNDTFICFGDSITLQASGGVSFEWTPKNLFQNPSSASQTITADSSLTITLYSISDQGCENFDEIYLDVQREIQKPIGIEDQSICNGDSINFNIPYEKYIEWSPNELFQPSNSNNTVFTGTTNTSVELNISNDCYRDSFEFYITVNPLPIVSTTPETDTIFRDESTAINASGASEYIWTPEEGVLSSGITTVEVSPFNTQIYIAEGIDNNGCKSIDSTLIVVQVKNLLLVPNAFSPNNDGLNDFFRIIRTLNIQEIRSFEIFNRWGQKIFSSTSQVGWDGMYRGEPQEMGVYVYKISATTRDGDEILKSGNLTLIR